ncbi:MAG TPA: hypothetical protein VGJ97_00700 [Anaerolineaceae bacterium]
MRKALFLSCSVIALILNGCTPTLPTPTITSPTQMVIPTQAILPSPTLPNAATFPPGATATFPAASPSSTAAPADTSVPQPATNPTAAPAPSGSAASPDISAQQYIDDRSDAAQLISSLFNAVNRKEYLRAYSYWDPTGAIKSQPFAQYQAGYANTKSVQLIIGAVTGDAGAGNFYYSLPVGLTSQNADGSVQKFAACYLLHLANPGVQGTLPFQSLAIQNAEAHLLQSGQDLNSQVGSACAGSPFNAGHALPAQPAFDTTDISATRYLDDRSDAVQVLRSMFNAINRVEYLRAYSYWEPAAAKQQLSSLDSFSKGYADTQSVLLTTGAVTSNAGAGQVYYTVPVSLVSQSRSGVKQTFVGCYTLHLSNPLIQATPPFQALAISGAKVQKVDSSANTGSLMASACQ